ncbi:MAG: GTPase [Treponema sp. CETP13]|nr:MAG: GTPase [Treponema sp. CETP13]
MAQFDWVQFYKEFAHNLLAYKDDRNKLIENVKNIYKQTGINLPTLEKDNQIKDIDPFTVFGLFNKSSLKESNRIKILNAIANIFAIKAPVPTNFDSIPVLNNQNATFYYFVGERVENDIDNLWEFFTQALAYADNPVESKKEKLSKLFDLVINCKGNGNSKVTMGIYWISPDSFLNLDSRNEWYIYESGKLPESFVTSLPKIEPKISAVKYFEIVEKLKVFLKSNENSFKDFKELSYEAWRYSEKVNQEKKIAKAKAKNTDTDIALAGTDVDTIHYWIYSPGDNACKWDEFYASGIMAIGWGEIGDLSLFDSKDEMKKKMKAIYDPSLSYKNAAHATWQFANDMKKGDVVFVKKGMHQVVGRGVVSSDYEYDDQRDDAYKNERQMDWTNKGEWTHPGQAAMKTLTDITSYTDYVAKLNALFEEEMPDDVEEEEIICPNYTEADFLDDVYIDADKYITLTTLIHNKKNIILQGAPGVGKTYAAKRLAYSMMGVKDLTRVMMIQFHQSYSYEDFIMGFRPSISRFELKKGPFYSFCKKAEIDSDNDYFFIIDEINRGNLSKIFGELFMLIENDKRGVELQLLYSDEKFSVPENVYIIGMMNTADRSLAMLDYALRRRFAFFELSPAFETDGFKKYQKTKDNEKFNRLILTIEQLNEEIENDETLGRGFRIGHSYLCTKKDIDDAWLKNVVDYELVPLLNEYWFDEPSKVKNWKDALKEAIK